MAPPELHEPLVERMGDEVVLVGPGLDGAEEDGLEPDLGRRTAELEVAPPQLAAREAELTASPLEQAVRPVSQEHGTSPSLSGHRPTAPGEPSPLAVGGTP